MAELVVTRARGLLIPDAYVTAFDSSAAAGTAATQAGNKAGRPVLVSSAATSLALEASGEQTADTTLQIFTARGGFASPDGAAFVWRLSDSEDYRGHDNPSACSAWEQIVWNTGTGSRYPHAITTQTGRVLVAYSEIDGADTFAAIRYRSAISGQWVTPAIEVYRETTTDYLYPALVEVGDRVYFFVLEYDGGLLQTSIYSSADDGNTWTTYARWVLDGEPDVSSATVKRLRVAHGNGQFCLVIWLDNGTDEKLLQYASNNGGASFSLVAEWSGASGQRGGNPDLVFCQGAFVLIYSDPDDTTGAGNASKIARVSDAYTSFLDAPPESPKRPNGAAIGQGDGSADITSGRLFSDWDQTLTIDRDETLYWFFRSNSDGVGESKKSYDGGRTWYENGVWFQADTGANDRPRNISACFQRGRAVVVSNWEANTATADYSLGAMYLGGASTVTLPAVSSFYTGENQQAWKHNWLPFEKPGDFGWTRTAAGTPTETLDNGKLTIGGGITTDQIFYTYNVASAVGRTVDTGVICRFRVEINSGRLDCKVHNDDGSSDYVIEVRATTTTIVVRDANAVTTLATVSSLAGAYDVLVAMRGAAGAVYYRAVGSEMSEDRQWSLAHAATSLTDGGGTLGAPRFQFGKLLAGTACNADVFEFHFLYDNGGKFGLEAEPSRPDELLARAFPTLSAGYVAAGVSIRAANGPTARNDKWSISTAYTYAVDNVLPSVAPSPRVGWRSTSTPGDLELSFTRDATVRPPFGNYAIGVYLDRINFPKFKVAGYGSSGWTELADVNCSQVVGFVRVGNAVKPRTTAAGASGYYLATDQLVGGYFYFPTSGDVRKIARNTAGYWSSGAVDEQRAIIYLEEIDDGEDAAGDTGQIWFPRALVTIALDSESNDYSKFRLEVDDGNTAPDPPDGYYTIGTAVIGSFALFGRDYDHGYSLETSPTIEVAEQPDGAIRTRVTGDPRRVYRLAYGEGIDVTDARGGGNSPSYVRLSDATGAPPVGSTDTAPLHLSALVASLDGAHSPVVLCPSIPVASSASGTVATVSLWDAAAGALYSRLTSQSVRLESIVGDDYETELFRVATLEFTEIV